MHHLRRLPLLLCVAMLAGAVIGPVHGAAAPAAPIARGRADLAPEDRISTWVAPRVDLAAIAREDAANDGRGDTPLRIGLPMKTDLSPANSGTWEPLPEGGRVWRLRVTSNGARWVVLGFDLFRLREGASLWVYDPAGKTVLGPFTASDVRDHGELWFPPVEGDTLIVELDWSAAAGDGNDEPRVHLGTVSHGYKPFGSIGRLPSEAFGDSGACNIDVKCPLGADWQDEKRGVVMLLSGGTGFCSGSLVNTTANDCRPYILTANHCGAGASTSFGFNFERPACGSGTPAPPTTQMVTGATVLGSFASSDFTLLQMSSAPPVSFAAYFNGWSRSPSPATNTNVIHHPSADAKKITRDGDPPINGSNWGPNHWRVQNYEQGTTEGGSSGSPLFDQNSRIVGQLHGGTASCSSITFDEFGKVSESWVGGGTNGSRLSNWLDPGNTGAMFADGIDHQTCLFQAAGSVTLNRDLYACTDTVAITLRDDDLRGNPTQTVSAASSTEPGGETVTLTPISAGSGTFTGTVPVAPDAAVPGDGHVSVSAGDTVTVSYVDLNDGTGHTVTVSDSALVDCSPPVLTGVQSLNVTGNSADIAWTSDEASTSRVHYGLAPPGGSLQSDSALVVSHTVHLTGLAECSTYYYWVDSTDGAGNTGSNDNSGAYYTFLTGKNVNPTYTYAGPPVPIPDNNATGASATISVPDVNSIQDVNVKVNITHSFDGDLILSLIGPDNTTVILSNRRGSTGDNFINTVFDDQASTAIGSGTAPFTGSFRPDAPLSAFNLKNPAGAWKLKVVDAAGLDTGSITGFALTFSYPPQACGPSLKHQSHAVTDVCNGSGSGGGNTILDPGEDASLAVTLLNNGTSSVTGITATVSSTTSGVTVTSPSSSYPNLSSGQSAAGATPFAFSVDRNLPCGATIAFHVTATGNEGTWGDNFTVHVGQPGSATTTYTSTDVPKPIADNATITSNLTIADTAAVLDVNVSGVSITHTFDGDLVLTLVGPTGVRVPLSNRRGSSGDNFTGTVFDDEAATPIASGTAPYSGSFRPESPLSAEDGISAAGVWKLEVQDAATTDTGSLTAWSLVLTTVASDTCSTCTLPAPGEVDSLSWSSSKDTLLWGAASDASYYYLYRGLATDLPALMTPAVDSCTRGGTGGVSMSGLAEAPSAGNIHWYLVRSSNTYGLGSAGTGSTGPRIQNSSGSCP